MMHRKVCSDQGELRVEEVLMSGHLMMPMVHFFVALPNSITAGMRLLFFTLDFGAEMQLQMKCTVSCSGVEASRTVFSP